MVFGDHRSRDPIRKQLLATRSRMLLCISLNQEKPMKLQMNQKFRILHCVLCLVMSCTAMAQYVAESSDLNQAGALKLAEQAKLEAQKLDKNVSVAVLNSSGVTILLLKGDHVGPHNSEASRRKAYTALSTKTPSLELMRNADKNPTAQNLNTLPELLLLGGGVPIWKDGQLVGSIGVSGAGGGEEDHNVAKKAAEDLGFMIKPEDPGKH